MSYLYRYVEEKKVLVEQQHIFADSYSIGNWLFSYTVTKIATIDRER